MVNVEFAYLFTPKGYVSIDLCAKRNTFETDFPEISSTNFNYVQFASAYYKGNKGFQKKKRNLPVIVKTYHGTKRPSYGL